MGGFFCKPKVMPQFDEYHKHDEETNGLLPSQIIEQEYLKNLENDESNEHILLRPSQIIKLENKRIKNLEFTKSKKIRLKDFFPSYTNNEYN